jgi:hypothetical protein
MPLKSGNAANFHPGFIIFSVHLPRIAAFNLLIFFPKSILGYSGPIPLGYVARGNGNSGGIFILEMERSLKFRNYFRKSELPLREPQGRCGGLLNGNGKASLSQLKSGVKADPDFILQGIGWLVREDKLRIEKNGRSVSYSLKGWMREGAGKNWHPFPIYLKGRQSHYL